MNRMEVIMTINKVGHEFGRVMESLNGEEFAAGYRRCVNDMVNLFAQSTIDPSFEAERENLHLIISHLQKENERLEQEVCEKHATIQKLLSHVNIAEVLGVETKKQEEPKASRRGVAFVFR